MKRTTKKLAGKSLEQFLKRFFLSQPEIDAKTAAALARAGQDAFSSVRVKALSLARCRRPLPTTASSQPSTGPATSPPPPPLPGRSPRPPAAIPQQPASSDGENGETAPFDPYAIGLVPTFQREGADGLMTRLAEITAPDQLRKMARAQQVALPCGIAQGGCRCRRHPRGHRQGRRQAHRRPPRRGRLTANQLRPAEQPAIIVPDTVCD